MRAKSFVILVNTIRWVPVSQREKKRNVFMLETDLLPQGMPWLLNKKVSYEEIRTDDMSSSSSTVQKATSRHLFFTRRAQSFVIKTAQHKNILYVRNPYGETILMGNHKECQLSHFFFIVLHCIKIMYIFFVLYFLIIQMMNFKIR